MKIKKTKSPKLFHTPNTQHGSGQFYGTGVKNPVVKPKEIMGVKASKKGLGKAPRSLA